METFARITCAELSNALAITRQPTNDQEEML
jgi:hypothetical protein